MNYDNKIFILKKNDIKLKLENNLTNNKKIEKKLDSNAIYTIDLIKINYLGWKQNRRIILTKNYLYNYNGNTQKLKYPLKSIDLIINNICDEEIIIRFKTRHDFHLIFLNKEKNDFIYNLLLLCLCNLNKVKHYKKSINNMRNLVNQKNMEEKNTKLLNKDKFEVF